MGKRADGALDTTDIEIRTLYLRYLMRYSSPPPIVTGVKARAARLFGYHCGYISDVTLLI